LETPSSGLFLNRMITGEKADPALFLKPQVISADVTLLQNVLDQVVIRGPLRTSRDLQAPGL
jgi:hypothetical protein